MQQSLQRRILLDGIHLRLAESPVVALLGARQVGKTTLAGHVAADWTGPTVAFDLEKPDTIEALRTTPASSSNARMRQGPRNPCTWRWTI